MIKSFTITIPLDLDLNVESTKALFIKDIKDIVQWEFPSSSLINTLYSEYDKKFSLSFGNVLIKDIIISKTLDLDSLSFGNVLIKDIIISKTLDLDNLIKEVLNVVVINLKDLKDKRDLLPKNLSKLDCFLNMKREDQEEVFKNLSSIMMRRGMNGIKLPSEYAESIDDVFNKYGYGFEEYT